ncbi:MAG: nuclear transport factor 2 family protein [Chitinophagaceae bacterium]|nr:nuclear transport factor 2 family protein [Oligoflexus sp.]
MTTLHKEILTQYFELFNGGYYRTILDLLDESVVHDTVHLQAETGKKAYESFLNRQAECYQEHVHDVVIMINDEGTHGAAEYLVTGTYRKTDLGQLPARGQVYTIRAGAFFQFNGDKISRVTSYHNLQEWLDKIR